jgi:hypothetical protein
MRRVACGFAVVAVVAIAAGCAPDLTIGETSSGGAGGAGGAGGTTSSDGGSGGTTSAGGGTTTSTTASGGGGAGGGPKSGSIVWADAASVGGDDHATGVAVDSTGAVRVSFDSVFPTGSFVNASWFEASGDPITVLDDVTFLQGGAGVARSSAAAVDSQDKLVIVGGLAGITGYEPSDETYAVSQGGMDCLIAKVGVSFDWARVLGGAGYSECAGVAIGAGDEIFVVGTFSGTVQADGVTLTSAGGEDIFVVRYSPAGTALQAWTFGDAFRQRAHAAGRDASGAIYVLGDDEGEGSQGGGDVLLLKLRPDTGEMTVRRHGSGSVEHGRALWVMPDGGVAMTGSFYGTLNLGGAVLGHEFLNEGRFVAVFDKDGQHVMSRGFYSDDLIDLTSVVVDAAGNTFVGGEFYYAFEVAGEYRRSIGGTDAFVAKVDPGGEVMWIQDIRSAENQGVGAMTLSPNGNLVVAGYTSGAIILGPWTLDAGSGADHFALEMVP